MVIDPDIETPDVPMAPPVSNGGTVAEEGYKQPFVGGYKSGGKVDLSNCKVSTHEKSKSSPNW